MTHLLAAFGPGLLVHAIPILGGLHLIHASRQMNAIGPDGDVRQRKQRNGVLCIVAGVALFLLDLSR